MFTWRRQRLIRGIVGSMSAGCVWWLFYLMGAWTSESRSPVRFVCFFLCILGLDRLLGAVVEVLSLFRGRQWHAHAMRN
jgi:hypothetical protein